MLYLIHLTLDPVTEAATGYESVDIGVVASSEVMAIQIARFEASKALGVPLDVFKVA